MVVDLAIDGQDDAVIGIGEWLRSALCLTVSLRGRLHNSWARPTNADDAEPFMAQYYNLCQSFLIHRGPQGIHFVRVANHTRVIRCDASTCGDDGQYTEFTGHKPRLWWFDSLQSGPLCRTLHEIVNTVTLLSLQTTVTYAFDSRKAVGLNFTTSGWL